MICVKCGADISDSAKACPGCGFKNALGIAEEGSLKICPQCGTKNRAAAKFCKMDGEELDGPHSKEKELDHTRHTLEGVKRRKKVLLTALPVICCCFILGTLGYYYRDHLIPHSQTPANESPVSPPAQLAKQTPIASKQPDLIMPPEPVPQKVPEEREEVKSIVNKRTRPEPKSHKNESVKSIVNQQPHPEPKPIPLEIPTQNTPVKIRTVPAGASIYVDGQLRGNAPATLMISQGNHQIRISREGYRDAETKLNVLDTMEFPIHISLEPDK